MKVLIATPLYPPDIGGPAKYAQEIGEELRRRGAEVSTVVYTARGKRLPPGVRHLNYLLHLLRQIKGCDFIFALDTWSAGVPAMVAATLARKRLVVRIGGDFLWEEYVERTGDLVKLSDFYTTQRTHSFSFKERLIFFGTRVLARRADALLFNTLWQRDVWLRPYGFAAEKSHLLENYYGGFATKMTKTAKEKTKEQTSAQVFVSATRGIKFKNISVLGRIFARLKKRYPDVVLDTKPLSPEKNRERLASCYAVVVPSISEINPNTVWEALAFGKPFICPLDTGCRERLLGLGLFVDTSNPAILEQAIETLLDEKVYQTYVKKIKAFTFTHSWGDIVDEILVATSIPPIALGSLRVLMISGDKRVLDPVSDVAKRIALQRAAVDRLDVFVWPQVHRVWDIVRALRHRRYDVVTAQDPFWRGLLAWVVARLGGARLNLQVHADLSGQSSVRRALAVFLLHRADTIRVVSKRAQDALPRNLSAPVSVLPVYIDLEPFRHIVRRPHARFAKTILWVGRFEPEKDPREALAVLERVRGTGIDAGLIMLGSGTLGEKLREHVAEQELGDFVEFPGWQDPKEYLATADLVLSTSLYESYGASMVESLAAGVPVVSLDVGVAKEAGATIAPPGRMAETAVEVLRKKARGVLQLSVLDQKDWAAAWKQTL